MAQEQNQWTLSYISAPIEQSIVAACDSTWAFSVFWATSNGSIWEPNRNEIADFMGAFHVRNTFPSM